MIRYDILYDTIRYDIILIDYNWVSSRWQCSVDLYKNRKQTATKENNTQNYTKAQNTQK